MNGEMDCDQVRDLAAEVAIGIADGQERDAALRHAATCPGCRQLVSEFSTVVDDLLILAPSHEPPPGFAAATVARISPPAAPARHIPARRRWLPRLAVAASVVAALAVGAGAVYQGTASDRQLADSYRAVLGQGHGSFFAAAPLRGPTGTVGTVFGYQGRPSWLFATVQLPASGPRRFNVQLITRAGRYLPAGSAVLGGTHATWGAQIPMDLTNLAGLRFVAATGGRTTIVANLNARGPWRSG
ncbi:MAG: hypothetical protein J2P30_19710 [Actinobacteria bacterium]|nr:hypothetical protein [Actinomycetota bacterium]